jgi:hypothetical protein
MEAYVESLHPSKKPTTKKDGKNLEKDLDKSGTKVSEPDYESGIRVPVAVLDECHNSFLAADSN